MRLIDLSHTVTDGLVTYPGLPAPVITDHLSFEDSHGVYAEGTEFMIGRIDMVANTGTYLDTPGHRHRAGHDLGERPVHTLLLAREIPVVEHLTGLDRLPSSGATFSAVPVKVAGLSTFPVRAFATVPD
jgi:kynurenine formamidase